jgi:prefoldin subunit 5
MTDLDKLIEKVNLMQRQIENLRKKVKTLEDRPRVYYSKGIII